MRGVLVLGLLVGKARDELVVGAFRRGDGGRLLQLAQGCDLDQLGRDLAQALLEARLARLPGDAAELVELGVGLVGAVARQKLDVLDRQEQLVAARVVELQAVVRGAQHGDGLEAGETADAVVGVHDEIADRQARRLGQDVDGGALLAARAHQPVAEDVLLADDGKLRRLEALLQPQHGERGRRSPAAPAPRRRSRPCVTSLRPWSASSVASRSRAPGVHAATMTRRCSCVQALGVRHDGVEHINVALLALGGERAAAASAPGAHVCGRRPPRTASGGRHCADARAASHAPASRNMRSGGTGL